MDLAAPRRLFRLLSPSRVAALAEPILSAVTAPFREGAVARAVRAFAARRPWVTLEEDPDGNLHLRRKNARPAADPAVFSAHMDHPGFLCRASARDGKNFRLRADFLGGVRDEYFRRGAAARFFPPDGPSVAARIVSQKKDPKTGDRKVLLAASAPVPPGTPGMWDLTPFRRDEEKGLLVSRAVDDLGGVAAALALFDVLPALDPAARRDVRAVLTRGEEVGFWGAVGAARARRFPPGARLISLETSKALPGAPVGAGPILRAGDRASVFDDGLTRSLAEAARELEKGGEFRWQRKLMDGGTCEGTAYQAYGYRTGALCVALLNYHNMGARGKTGAEAISLADLAGMARWMAFWALKGGNPRPLKGRMEALYGARRKSAGESFSRPSSFSKVEGS